ncbi:hypothetical protein B0H15DRAFT_949684 [Mycena belliarum]|uniref:Uncharacterized protein n=1 Tax=Mycena belliarum TaxID=1033014 RepID=A0AAD6U5A1_9AGAR|nr:hypothetical protein B0H15DRAFT_949684 [Mycena belliae]
MARVPPNWGQVSVARRNLVARASREIFVPSPHDRLCRLMLDAGRLRHDSRPEESSSRLRLANIVPPSRTLASAQFYAIYGPRNIVRLHPWTSTGLTSYDAPSPHCRLPFSVPRRRLGYRATILRAHTDATMRLPLDVPAPNFDAEGALDTRHPRSAFRVVFIPVVTPVLCSLICLQRLLR